jgi:hypothetical protein
LLNPPSLKFYTLSVTDTFFEGKVKASSLHIDGVNTITTAFKCGQKVKIGLNTSSDMDAMIGFAKKSEEILLHAAPASLFDLRLHYRTCLEGMGYRYRGGQCRLDELSSDIVDHFGKAFLRWLGLFRTGQEARDWLVPLLCQGQAAPPTIAHILLTQFVQSGKQNERRAANLTALHCPCNLPEHEDGVFKGDVVWHGKLEGTAKCFCGSSFRFHLDEHAAVVDKVWRYARCYQDEAEKLLAEGVPVNTIAQKLGVSAMTTRRLCRSNTTDYPQRERFPASFDVELARQKWLKTVEHFGSIVVARRMARRIYRALLKHDREWLYKHRTGTAGPNVSRVDWALRDAEFVLKLRKAAEEIASQAPPRWVSAISILMVAKVPLGTRNQLMKLPKCRALIRQVVETRQQFHQRRRHAGTQVATADDKVVSS